VSIVGRCKRFGDLSGGEDVSRSLAAEFKLAGTPTGGSDRMQFTQLALVDAWGEQVVEDVRLGFPNETSLPKRGYQLHCGHG
jgi:hypothetical protein